MITTSMGSLPFTDAKEACDFAFKFTLPFFPELAKADAQEFLIARLEHFYQRKNSQQFCDEAFRKKVLEENPEKIKWQVVCPLTFFRYQTLSLTQKESLDLVNGYIKERLAFFRSFFKGEIYLCLDAPGISFKKEELLILKNFLTHFKGDKLKIGLHLCQKIEKNFRVERPYFDFCCFDALLNQDMDLSKFTSLFDSLIYGIYDFRSPQTKIPSFVKIRAKDGISTVCGLNEATSHALLSCLDYFAQVNPLEKEKLKKN